jgi:integrase
MTVHRRQSVDIGAEHRYREAEIALKRAKRFLRRTMALTRLRTPSRDNEEPPSWWIGAPGQEQILAHIDRVRGMIQEFRKDCTVGDTLPRAEVHRLLMRAKRTQRIRDYLMLLMLHQYALSPMDVIRLRRDHIDLDRGRLLTGRMSRTVERQIGAKDLQEIKLYLASRSDLGPWMFVSRTGKPRTDIGDERE